MFVSGTTYQLLELGQPLDNGVFAQESSEHLVAHPPQENKRKLSVSVKPTTSSHSNERTSPAGSTKTGGSKGGPSLLDLIEAGMLQPGPANMKVTYKGNTYAGALQCNGTILFRGTTFNTPSAFSVHVKRLVTPNKQGDDGWHSVYVDGVILNAVRQQYHAKMLGQPYKQQPNKTPRRSQSSPRGQQQQQQQQVAAQQQQQQQQHVIQQPQQQQLGLRPPLPTPKLKLGNIKGLPQQHQQQQQQQELGHQLGPRVLQPAAPPEQTQPKPHPHKLKFKVPLKLGKGNSTGVQPAVDGPLGQQQQQQQQHLDGPQVACPLDPHQPTLQGAPLAQQQQQVQEQAGPRWVRCCRCEQLRCVPDECWSEVQAVGANWFCEDASWDVKQQQPFTAACMWADTADEGMMVPGP